MQARKTSAHAQSDTIPFQYAVASKKCAKINTQYSMANPESTRRWTEADDHLVEAIRKLDARDWELILSSLDDNMCNSLRRLVADVIIEKLLAQRPGK